MSSPSNHLFLLLLLLVIPFLAFLWRAARRHANMTRVSRVLSYLRAWASIIFQPPTPPDEPLRTPIMSKPPVFRKDESARWEALLTESEATIEQHLSRSLHDELATFTRCVTFHVFLMVFLGVELDVGNPVLFARVREATEALSEFYDDGQGKRKRTLPSEVKDSLDAWLPPNHLERILPAYEVLWRIIATIVVTCEDDGTRSLRWVMLDFRDNPRDRQYSVCFDSDGKSASDITNDAVSRVMAIAGPQHQPTESNSPLSCIQNATWGNWNGNIAPTVQEGLKFAALVASKVIGRVGVHYGISDPVDGGGGESQGSSWNQRNIFKINHNSGHHTINVVERPHIGTSRQVY